jgi:hypothetical protein
MTPNTPITIQGTIFVLRATVAVTGVATGSTGGGAGMIGGPGCVSGVTGGNEDVGNEDVLSGLVAMPALAAATASGARERPHSPQNCSPSLTSP